MKKTAPPAGTPEKFKNKEKTTWANEKIVDWFHLQGPGENPWIPDPFPESNPYWGGGSLHMLASFPTLVITIGLRM